MECVGKDAHQHSEDSSLRILTIVSSQGLVEEHIFIMQFNLERPLFPQYLFPNKHICISYFN